MTTTASTSAAVGQAFKEVREFDRAKISARAGLVAAVPVAAMLALGIAVGSPTDAVSMGVGAMLVGVAWRAGDGPLIPPIPTMVVATLALTISTMIGTLTGRWPWLHLGVLVLVCLVAGLATSLGRRGISPGNQAVIAYVVFGRFPEDFTTAVGLASLVLAGGTAQTLFAFVVGTPVAWRRQRQTLARAYRRLADLTGALEGSAAASARALEDADTVLAVPALFADPGRAELINLVEEGRRIRLELAALASTVTQTAREQPDLNPEIHAKVTAGLERLGQALRLISAVISGGVGGPGTLAPVSEELSSWGAERAPLPVERVDERLGALIGQVAAAARTAAALGVPEGRLILVGRPTLGERGLASRLGYLLRSDFRQMRANATLRSASGRHALRLAVVVAGTELLTQRVALPRGYWAVVAAATVLRPGFGATFRLGAERVLGTCAGVVVATLIAVAIDPSGWGIVAVVAVLAYGTYTLYPASFAAGTAMMTAVIVFLLHVVVGDSVTTALDRGLDTVIGGGIGLAAYALWPTWSAHSTGPQLSLLVDAQRDYLRPVLAALTGGGPVEDAVVRAGARRARMTFADTEAVITLARSEPRRGDTNPTGDAATLGALRRVVFAVHALRLELKALPPGRPRPQFAPLSGGLEQALSAVSVALHGGDVSQPLPPLRRMFRQLDWDGESSAVRPALDELVDAVNTAASSAGLQVP